MGSERRALAPFAALAVALVAAGALGAFAPAENAARDASFRLVTRSASDAEVTIVAIDPRSLETFDRWPWPRGLHASLVEALFEAGARRVAFDVDFSSRSLPEEDAEFAAALADAPRPVILATFRRQVGSDASERGDSRPLPDFSRHAVPGSIEIRPGSDGVTRRYAGGAEIDGAHVPSLAAALLAGPDADPATDAPFAVDFGIDAGDLPTVSYVDVLTGAFDPEAFRDRDVLVGATAVELGDYLAVPRYGVLPGCVVQALAYESLRRDRALAGTPWYVTAVGLAAICLLVGPWIARRPWRQGLALAVGLVVAVVAVSLTVQATAPLQLPTVPWTAACLACYGLGLVRRIDGQALSLLIQGRRLSHVVESTFDAIVTVAPDGTVETLNPAAERLFRARGDALAGRPLETILAPSDPSTPFPRTTADGPFEAVGRTADGRRFPVEMTLSPYGEGRRVAVLRDIAERKTRQELLRHQATHDALTGLPNRYLLHETLRDALRGEGERALAVLLLDLDRFKEINDTLGHETGDELLCAVGERLRRTLDPGETLARLGGDEFAVVLPGAGREDAVRRAAALVRSLESGFRVQTLDLHVESAIGVALAPEHGHAGGELLRVADVAMYQAKRDRTVVEVYDAERDPSSVRALTIGGELRQAIAGDGLWLAYQPKIDARSGGVIGVEALVRWRHPIHGEIRPDEFIGPAEQSGLIRPLTAWVLRTAIEQAARWRREGLELNVAVNVSARNLLDDEMPTTLRSALDEFRLPARLVTLEITESAIMTDPNRALEVVTALARSGVSIAIDDFGTGYSSLGYLKRLPAHELKIDRSFVQEMDRDDDDAAIVRSTIELAHNLGLKVVAEGVETREVWEALRTLGCDTGQGYFFGKPQPAEDLRGLFAGSPVS